MRYYCIFLAAQSYFIFFVFIYYNKNRIIRDHTPAHCTHTVMITDQSLRSSIESSLSGINSLYDKWKTILNSGNTANNPEFKYLNDQILQNIDGCVLCCTHTYTYTHIHTYTRAAAD